MRQSFEIRDSANRIWGDFDVIKFEHGEVYGFLNANQAFNQVQGIFREHEKAFNDLNGDTESTGKKIIELGAYLIDNESGSRVNIEVIFINEDLLVTCLVEKQ